MARHTKIFLGLVTGAVAGVFCNKFLHDAAAVAWMQKYLSDPLGRIFLNLLIMVVIPLVFASLALGVAQIGDLKQLGRIGLRTIGYFLLVTAIAVTIGLVLVNTIRPGDYLPAATKEKLMAQYSREATEKMGAAEQASTEFGIQTLVNIVPRNPIAAVARPNPDMLALIFVALMAGVGLTLIAQDKAQPVVRLLEGVYEISVKIINLAMKLAPYGVAALIFSVTSRFGFDLIVALGMYVLTVILGLALHLFGALALLVRLFAHYSPLKFFRKVETVMLTAFSTSSSNATLPTTLTVAQENLGIPPKICGFVIPLGATMNMNGTALFEGVTVLFLAQVFGVPLDLSMQLIVVIMSVLTAVGAAGVPSGSIPLLILVLQMVHVPPEGIAIILGVDRILDMCRTVLNVTGDITCAAYVARSEGVVLKE
ncbi:MAG: dicarboxylate/amino acid:cation symporter [candidate division KSB1 bacterium]|nr:dicarboxylate/amino acid:cation symporter [candidate division KSB1 bacterium]MDZ7274942.1 dicarboxylate/amino acid:cation symporter [candidate division KSB1 bacterium]MDZ7286607.1 dicarboxylate/amino acid:cation symporter [candidate division KSB1 bacterium]MDZ7299229.1 dicarboxylate/amino acid:cation symporter [candidate division KSB1 bacterium]MDZ7309590.1 dicarboxylate/amino acid:cation symporter [candidate division KSB1 bacterium]